MIVIENVKVLDPISNQEQKTQLLVNNGRIEAIAPEISNLPSDLKTINGEGWIAGPGLVDLYSHSGEPGYETRETLISLANAAKAGGYTRLSILPDMIPTLDNLAMWESLQQKTSTFDNLKWQFWGALTVSLHGEQMSEMMDLAPKVVGFSDGYAINNLNLLRRILEYLQPFAKPIALVPLQTKLKGNGVVREGVNSIGLGLPGNPSFSEAIAITAILELVASVGTPVHLMRISTARGVELIAEAKKQGLPITASTTWMHLLYSTEDISTYDVNLRLEPPLGNPSDQDVLIEGVKTGIIDAIAVDHTPYTYEEKTLAFAQAPSGAIGLELILPALWNRFVINGDWSGLQLWRALSTNPLLCLGEKPVSPFTENNSEIIVFDPQKTWVVNRENVKSLSNNTPLWGKEVRGRVIDLTQ